jgi:hypothetical protein
MPKFGVFTQSAAAGDGRQRTFCIIRESCSCRPRLSASVGPQSARRPVLPFVLRTFMRYDLHNTRVETG